MAEDPEEPLLHFAVRAVEYRGLVADLEESRARIDAEGRKPAGTAQGHDSLSSGGCAWYSELTGDAPQVDLPHAFLTHAFAGGRGLLEVMVGSLDLDLEREALREHPVLIPVPPSSPPRS